MKHNQLQELDAPTIIFYYPTICNNSSKNKIVKIFSVCYIEMVHLKIKAKVLERMKNVLPGGVGVGG